MKTERRVLRWAGPAALALLTGAVALHGLGEKSFWIDEGSTGVAVLGSWSRIWQTATQHEPNLGLYYSLLKVWSILGTSEFVLRLFSVLCMAATAPLLYLLGRRLFNQRVGLIAGVLFGVNAFVLRFAQEARPYALGVLMVTVASLLLVIALESGSARWWVLYTVTVVVAVFADPWAATVIAAHVAAILLHHKRPSWKLLALAGLIVGVILGPFVFRLLTTDVNRVKWIPQTTIRGFVSTIEQLAGGTRTILGLYMAASLLTLATLLRRHWSDRRGGEGRPDWSNLYIGMLFAVPIVLILGAGARQPVFIPRYVIVALPGLVLLAAAGLDRLRLVPLVAGATAVFVVAAVPGLRQWYGSDFKADWRGGVALVTERRAPGDVVLIHRQGRGAFLYYDDSLPVFLLRDAIGRTNAVRERARVWLVLYPTATDRLVTDFQAKLSRSHRMDGEWRVNRIVLRLYTRTS